MNTITQLSEPDFLKWLGKQRLVDKPLTPENELYEPIYAHDPGDPIKLIHRDIEFSEVESLNFISGFRGSGKTTELFRLQKMLKEQGYFVAYANALDYLLPSEPVDISDFLMVLAGSFSEAIEKELKIELGKENFWSRFWHYLKTTNVQLEGFDVEAKLPGTDVGLNFKTALREVPSFREKLRKSMAGRIGEIRREVQAFFEFGRQKVKDESGTMRNIVFIFDQLEQLRDTLGSEGHVTDSVAALIANHRSDLQIPFFHMVFTVPPWLKFKLPDLAKIRLLYNVKLWNNNRERSTHDAGRQTMRRIVERRFTKEGMGRYFGPLHADGSSPVADELIKAAGGHFRDLILLLRETLLRVDALPLDPRVVVAAIANLRASFLPIPIADATWLHEIGEKRDSLLKDRSPESVQRMTFFLDTHCALILRNGEEWYDVHPIIRDEVAEIVKREATPRDS